MKNVEVKNKSVYVNGKLKSGPHKSEAKALKIARKYGYKPEGEKPESNKPEEKVHVSTLAKQIREEGESWADALARAGAMQN